VRTDWHESNWLETLLTRSHGAPQPCRAYRASPSPNPSPNPNPNHRQETFRRATQTIDVTGEARARRALGVSEEAEWAEVKQAHRALALQYHPDKNRAGEQPDASRFREVQEAYDLLSTLHKRRRRPERSDEE